jgi:hypothetical protein
MWFIDPVHRIRKYERKEITMEEALANLGISYLLTMIKNPKKKATMKKVFLKVFKTIWAQFQNDPEFKAVVGVE